MESSIYDLLATTRRNFVSFLKLKGKKWREKMPVMGLEPMTFRVEIHMHDIVFMVMSIFNVTTNINFKHTSIMH